MLAAVLVVAGCAERAEETSSETESLADAIAVDVNGDALGTVRFPTSCTDDVQPLIERGLALLHHMNYIKAKDTFIQASEVDEECAIAYWGAAMTHVHPLWPDTIRAEAQKSGQELLNKATDAKHSSARELAYINALQGYYRENNRSEIERLRAFEDGWASAHENNPDDLEASLFYALALTATAPSTDKTFTKQKMAGAIAEKVKAEFPLHPGAHHYIIHAYDNPVLAENALDTARNYDDVAPENTHALHMTSHIFTRRGLWPESITFNRRAANAALDRTPAGAISIHYLHALDYLAYAFLQQANDQKADEVLKELSAREAISEMEVLQEQAEALNMAYDWGIQVAIQKTAAEGWLAFEQGEQDKSLELMRQAAEMEASTDKNPITPSAVLPARELYGDLLLATGDYDAALSEYEAALERAPNRFYSLYGAARAAELADDSETAARYYQQLLDNCPDPSADRPQLEHARNFLG